MKRSLVLLAVLAAVTFCGTTRAEDWAERMWRQMQRKVSFELVDTKLTEACDFLSTLTGLNIILAPDVRTKNPAFSLRVTDMDAGTALKWFTELSDTHADVKDNALYITLEPSRELKDQEREALMLLGAEHNVVVDLPPAPQPLTDQDRIKAVMQIMEKEQAVIQDFPGPEISVGAGGENGVGFQFKQR
jgi:hypothetical protein